MSLPSEPPGDLSFRPGVNSDWPVIAQIIKDNWGGEDYLTESLWQQWAADSNGKLIVATGAKGVIGCARITELGPAEWWLEGVRVASAVRKQGIGRAIMAEMLRVFGEVGIGLLRFGAGGSNEAMAKLAAEFAFRRINSYAPMEADVMPADYRSFKLLQPGNLDVAHQYLRRSPMNRVNHFAEHNLVLYYITQERLSQYLAEPEPQVLGWRQFDQLHGLAIVFGAAQGNGDNPMQVGYIDAPDDTTMLAMLAGLRGIAAKRGYRKISWMMPQGVGLDRLVGTTNLVKMWDEDFFLYERPLRI